MGACKFHQVPAGEGRVHVRPGVLQEMLHQTDWLVQQTSKWHCPHTDVSSVFLSSPQLMYTTINCQVWGTGFLFAQLLYNPIRRCVLTAQFVMCCYRALITRLLSLHDTAFPSSKVHPVNLIKSFYVTVKLNSHCSKKLFRHKHLI